MFGKKSKRIRELEKELHESNRRNGDYVEENIRFMGNIDKLQKQLSEKEQPTWKQVEEAYARFIYNK